MRQVRPAAEADDETGSWPALARSLARVAGELDGGRLLERGLEIAHELVPGSRFAVATRLDGAAWQIAPGSLGERRARELIDDPAAITAVHDRAEIALLSDGAPATAEPRERLAALAVHLARGWSAAARYADATALAARDPLTGLLNHRSFREALAHETALAQDDPANVFSLVLFDLDGFKAVNDRHGHAAGDRVLRAVSGAIATSSRGSDLAFRIGGDEFALLLPGAGADAAGRVGHRVREIASGLDHRVGPSFGVVTWPTDGRTTKQLLANVDRRLYDAKRGAGAHLVPEAEPASSRARARLELASRLAGALAPLRDEGEIAQLAVDELHSTFHYYLAVVHVLSPDGLLRVVAAAGPLAGDPRFLAFEQHLSEGINGRVARTGAPALVSDTRHDPDYLRRDPRTDPGSELCLPIHVADRVWGVLNLEQVSTDGFDDDDLLLAQVIAAQIGAAVHRTELFAETEGALLTTLATLCDALEAKDAYTATHARDVAELAEAVAGGLGLDGEARRRVRYAALLHDIGKIGVPTEILRKPGPLDDDELAVMRTHADIGADLLARIGPLAAIAPLVRASHERWDGDGYPRGLRGEEIPVGARIVCACDAFDAMTSTRPYRAARPLAEALGELRRCAGDQFDPAVVAALEGALERQAGASSDQSLQAR